MNLHCSSTSVSRWGHWSPAPSGDIFLIMGNQPPPLCHTPIDESGIRTEIFQGEVVSAPPPGGTGSQRGMTLVEILIVVALLGIAALVALTNLQTLQRRFQLENNVRDITAFLNDVPNHAKEQNAPVFLVWDGTARTFSITTDFAATNVLNDIDVPQELTITGPGAPILRCDVYSRTFVGTSTVMMATLQTMSITHRDTPEASAPTYGLSLSPLWGVEVSR